MELYLKKIAQKIADVAQEEDEELQRIADEGIFHMPELAFVYACGKRIMKDYEAIFSGNKPKWIREQDLGNGGPTDLIFRFDDGKKIAIEFKMRATRHAYERDLEKLSKLTDSNTARVFCALVDIFEKDLPGDGRLSHFKNISGMKVCSLIEPKPSFKTKEHWYPSKAVFCVVGVWSVGDSPVL